MATSRRDAKYEFNKDKWVISLVNTGPGESINKFFGHAVILVEGVLENGDQFLGEYDITASALPEEQSHLQGSLGNIMGYITKIRCNPKQGSYINAPDAQFAGAYRDYSSEQYSSNSWYAAPEAALKMIRTIEDEAGILDQEISQAIQEGRDINWPFKYQKAGANRWSIWGGNSGHNCITWAEEKLALAGVGNGRVWVDSKMASTEMHVTRCSII